MISEEVDRLIRQSGVMVRESELLLAALRKASVNEGDLNRDVNEKESNVWSDENRSEKLTVE